MTTLTNEQLNALVGKLLESGITVLAEDKKGTGFAPLTPGENAVINNNRKPANTSFKEYLFPKTEPVLYFKKRKDEVELFDIERTAAPLVIFGARPCDAKSVDIIRKLFNWDYKDDFFNTRADNTIIIGAACAYRDASCFCTAVNLAPDSPNGSDVFLAPSGNGSFSVAAVTEKGKLFLEQFWNIQIDTASGTQPQEAPAFQPGEVRNWLEHHFEEEFWQETGGRCLGCGRCTYTCPTCHCFDIVDEEQTFTEGRRMKNWDSCQFGLFTKHASGHNPRSDQAKRFRQRVSHKFAYYPERFGEILCTGCGRCSRGCPVGVDLLEILTRIQSLSRETAA